MTQILSLLKLGEEAQERVVRMRGPLPTSGVNERKLRRILGLSEKEQKRRLKGLLSAR